MKFLLFLINLVFAQIVCAEVTFEYKAGLVEFVGVGNIHLSEKVPDGWFEEYSEIKVISETNRVPLKRNERFGIEYTCFNNGVEDLYLDEVVIFPGDGIIEHGKSKPKKMSIINKICRHGSTTAFAYTMGEDYELIPGEWIFQIRSKGEIFLSHVFYVL